MDADAARQYSESRAMIGAGWWRQVAWAHRQGIPTALGLTLDAWVRQYVGGHVRLRIEDRREAVAELTAESLSTRAIGGVLRVGATTVGRDQAAPDGALPPAEAPPVADPVMRAQAYEQHQRDHERRQATDTINGVIRAFADHPLRHGDGARKRAEALWAAYEPRSRRWLPPPTLRDAQFARDALAQFVRIGEEAAAHGQATTDAHSEWCELEAAGWQRSTFGDAVLWRQPRTDRWLSRSDAHALMLAERGTGRP